VALLFFVRNFPTEKSEFSGLILQVLPGRMAKLINHRNICLSMKIFRVSKLSQYEHQADETGRNARSVREKNQLMEGETYV
jgi:hypothetical protein